ncbi:polyphosphate polymerase domain-containing protein [Dactylosporangium sp. NPDC049525]|uniref:polyphosphate polymerase domain-containing protein n=1 Tax=Dactylosporangium sp. NPDC049525 TaxID=3154730 RepID=UPI0034397FD8
MTAALDVLEPIGLDELVARASLLTRVDRKYLLPADRLPQVLRGLAGVARVLDVDGRRRFGYRSDYFDTPGLDSYLAAAHRRRRRFKVRVRTYLDTGGRYVEVKTRGPRGTTVKERVQYSGGTEHLSGDALDGIHVPCDTELLRPVLITRYERTTLYLPATGGRVTVDAALAWHLDDGTTLRVPDRVIVETKAASGACEADRLLWSLGHRPCAVSKYGTGLAALRPDLPANRWRPTLRRHFPSAPSTRES